jgi:hypothetical protein
VDASAHFDEFQQQYVSDSVNRKYRGGLNQTRDPFIGMQTSFADTDTESVFRSGNVSGVFGYEAISPGTTPHIIVAVGDSILAGRVFTRAIEFRTLYKGIDPQWEHSFFVQEQNLLVWQNGKDLPMAWDGSQADMKLVKDYDGVTNPMPIGNIMVSANGRILVATEGNLVFASNYVYSKGLGTTVGALDFTESTYPNSGDGFGAYSEIGPITGMATLPAPGTTNGDGEVIVFGPRGAWSINTNLSRDLWTASDIQRKVLVGRGTISPESIVLANNDIWYRSSDRAIASFRTQLTDKKNRWSDQSLSSEVQPYLDYDDSINLRFSSGMYINNRLFMSCALRKSDSDSHGIHRYGLGMAVLDFDRGSSTSRSDEGYSWDGLYTGPRVVGMVKLTPDLQERGFFISHDKDGVNRVYETVELEVEDRVGDDLTDNRIESFYTTHPLFETQEAERYDTLWNLKGSTIKFQDALSASFSQEFTTDVNSTWKELFQLTDRKCECKVDSEDCGGQLDEEIGGDNADRINSTSTDEHTLPSGEFFKVRTCITGRASVRMMRVGASSTEIDNTATVLDEEDECENKSKEDFTKRFSYNF